MSRFRIALALRSCVALSLLGGCMPKMTRAQLKEAMEFKKPAELGHLSDFVGVWEGTGEATMAMLDEPAPLPMSGRSEARWSDDGWYVVQDFDMTMADFEPMRGLWTWSYDTKAKKYRTTWVDNMGSTGFGEATRDAATGTWRWSSRSYGAWGEGRMSGTMRLVDPKTMEWTMAEHMGLMKTAEFRGTNRRVK